MITYIKKVLNTPDLAKKIGFTVMMLFVCRIGAFVPVPGINGDEALKVFRFATGGGQNLFQLVDIFSGGAFAQMTVIALGVMPYISASIIIQILMAAIPSIQREIKENHDAGKRKLGRWIRLLTVVLAFFQSSVYARYALQMNASHPGIVLPELLGPKLFGAPVLYYMIFVTTMTTGTIFLMWLGEQISERGVGNGISMIISIGILSSLPGTLGSIFQQLNLDSQEPGQLSFTALLVLITAFIMIIMGTILVIQGQRKVPLQYARKTFDLNSSDRAYIPLKINYAGVIPVIFASSMMMFPATIAQFLSSGRLLQKIVSYLSPGSWVYLIVYVSLIFFFTYFWTATQFHPDQIASDLKKGGAFIPGVRQGKPTQEYLEKTMNRITFVGAIFLALVAILPTLVAKFLKVDQSISQFFGGTSLLILVGVILDTFKQMESHMLMNRYEGFMKKRGLVSR